MATPDFGIHIEKHPAGMTHVFLSGKLDTSSIDAFETEMKKLYDAGTYVVEFDLSQLEAISSAGIGSLINAFSIIEEHDGFGTIKGLNERVRDAFNLVGFTPDEQN